PSFLLNLKPFIQASFFSARKFLGSERALFNCFLRGPIRNRPACRGFLHFLCILLHHPAGTKVRHHSANGFLDNPKPALWYSAFVAIIEGRYYFQLQEPVERVRLGGIHLC